MMHGKTQLCRDACATVREQFGGAKSSVGGGEAGVHSVHRTKRRRGGLLFRNRTELLAPLVEPRPPATVRPRRKGWSATAGLSSLNTPRVGYRLARRKAHHEPTNHRRGERGRLRGLGTVRRRVMLQRGCGWDQGAKRRPICCGTVQQHCNFADWLGGIDLSALGVRVWQWLACV